MKSISFTFWYAFLILGFIVVLAFEVNFFINRGASVNEDAQKVTQNISVLKQRLDSLKSVQPTISADVEKVTKVLPTENSSLLVTAALRSVAKGNTVELKNLRLTVLPNEDVQNDISKVQLSFSANGTTQAITSFIDSLMNSNPFVGFESLRYVASNDLGLGQISISSYWSPLPTKLPSLEEPLLSLTQEETQMLSKIETLKVNPVQNAEVPVATTSGVVKEDPFSL